MLRKARDKCFSLPAFKSSNKVECTPMEWLLGAGAAATATLFLAYASKSPSSQIFRQAFVSGANPAHVALTYDDGPNDPYTFQLLELLEKHQARATFFVVGKFVKQRPDIVR